MNIGDTVKVLHMNEIGTIINTGEGWSYEDGNYILYSVMVGKGRMAVVYSVRASAIVKVG